MKRYKVLHIYITVYAESQAYLKLIIHCLDARGTRSTMRRRRRSRRLMRRRWATSPTWARTQRSSQVCLANNHCG
jgi:hypothetical protein